MHEPAQHKRETDLTPESFGQMLTWLDRDPERAGERYEQIRRGLIKIFLCRGCTIAEDLADETVNRVAAKAREIVPGYVGEPASYFYAVAEKIYLEYSRTEDSQFKPLSADVAEKTNGGDKNELKYECLEECMKRLPPQTRELFRAYYEMVESGREKGEKRKELANRLGIETDLLWLKAHRIRGGLRKCIEQCLLRKEVEWKR